MKRGDLVQIMKDVQGQGDIGIVLGRVDDTGWARSLLKVLFHDGTRDVHIDNLQKPDGRTRRKL